MHRPQLNAYPLASQLWKLFPHLSIENERGICIELFLKLQALFRPPIPGTSLKHRQHYTIRASVVGKSIQHSRSFKTTGHLQ